MKKLIISLLMFFMFLNLNAQEPQIKIRLADGTERTYLISDVEEMNFPKSEIFSYLSIYFTDDTKANFDTKSIEKMEISEENELLSVYTCGYPYSYEIISIDSIIYGYDTDGLYETITIGEQVWMQYNLDVCHYRNGDPILHTQTDEEWEQAGEQGIGAWCYNHNDPDNGVVYGKLYNWYAVNDGRGLAPEGWRVASDVDWKELEMELGMTQERDGWGWRGGPVGAKLAGGYDLWLNGSLRNHNDFNSSGFSGLPGGFRYRNGSLGFSFGSISYGAYWWSSTEYRSTRAVTRTLYCNDTYVRRYFTHKRDGFSVRCVRDE